MKIDFSELTVEVQHPHFPEVVVEVVVLDDTDKMEYFADYSKYTHAQALVHPETKELIFLEQEDGARQIAIHEVQSIPFSEMVSFVHKHIRNWRGLTNSKDVPYEINEINVKKLLFGTKLNVTEVGKGKVDKNTGKPTDKVIGFWSYLNDYIMGNNSKENPTTKP